MKLKPYLTISLLLTAALAKAQKADTAEAIVHYKFTHVRDTANRDKPLNENMLLMIGRNASAYKSYDRKLREEQMRKSVMEQVSMGTGNIRVNSGGQTLGPNIDYYQFPNEGKLFITERLFNSYIVEQPMPALQWKISTDTASFSGLSCQKATTHFKGRDYIAWFCADLPYRAGPWKLNGLPGLIVEAYDTKKEVVFKFDGLEKVDKNAKAAVAHTAAPGLERTIIFGGSDGGGQNPNVIALPSNAIKTTTKELNELKEIMRKDPQAFAQSQMAAMQSGGGGRISIGAGSPNVITSVNVQGPPAGAAKNVTNNPIELPEKK